MVNFLAASTAYKNKFLRICMGERERGREGEGDIQRKRERGKGEKRGERGRIGRWGSEQIYVQMGSEKKKEGREGRREEKRRKGERTGDVRWFTSSLAQFSKLAKRLRMSGLASKVYCLERERERESV